jgi:glutamate dehydrogenase/leucine dehydrogenase
LSPKRPFALSKTRYFPEFDNHEFVIALNDQKSGLKAYIAIHSTKPGPAHGGTRMKEYRSDDEALRDVLKLSKAMTYKSALAKLPYGGAKGVIIVNGSDSNREQILKAYAQKIEQLHGLFRTGTDVGLSDSDVEYMSSFSRYFLGLHTKDKGEMSTSNAAALGVYIAIKTSLKYRFGSDELKNRVIGIKGVGKLGGELVKLLVHDGATLIIADPDNSKTEGLRVLFPKQIIVVDPNEIHKHVMDVYAPCALGAEFTPSVIRKLACSIVVGGANNQLPNEKAGDELYKKGILYAPDYIVNVGGLIFVSEDLESDGFHSERVQKRLDHIAETLTDIFHQAEIEHMPTHRVAERIAKERFDGTHL